MSKSSKIKSTVLSVGPIDNKILQRLADYCKKKRALKFVVVEEAIINFLAANK